jgi:hypothetical protein
MHQFIDTLINGPARYTQANNLSPMVTIVVIVLAIVAEFVLFYFLVMVLVRFFQNIPLFIGYILRKCGVGAKVQPKVFLELVFPAQSDKSSFATEQLHILLRNQTSKLNFWERLAAPKTIHAMEIFSARDKGISYIMTVPASEVEYIERSLNTYLPGLKITQIKDYLERVKGISAGVIELNLTSDFVLPLRDHSTLKEHDPIGYLTGQMTKLEDNELIAFQLVLTPVLKYSHRRSLRHINNIRGRIKMGRALSSELKIQRTPQERLVWLVWFPPVWFIAMMGKTITILAGFVYSVFSKDGVSPSSLASNSQKKRTDDPYETELGKTIKTKLDQQLFEASIRVMVASSNTEHITQRLGALVDAFEPFSSSSQSIHAQRNLNLPFIYTTDRQIDRFKQRSLTPHFLSQQTILSSSELSDLYHFPNSISAKTENVIKSLSKTLPASVSLKDGTKLDVILGMNKHHGTNTPIGLTAAERERHMYIIGGTGNGKTTMLEYAIMQDIKSGKGVAVIDPHGDSSRNIISHIPEERIKDVIYLNPRDLDHPIGLNLLELPEGLTGSELAHAKDMATEAIISVLQKIFDDNADTSAYKIERTLRNAIHTAFVVEDATLFTVLRLLTDIDYRKKITRKLKDESLIRFWKEELGKAGDMQRVKISSGPINRIERFERSESAKRMIEQSKSTIDFDDILNSSKILICNFPKGRLGEDTSTLMGTTVLAMLQLAAWRRDELENTDRVPFYLYVDEFQNFASQSFLALFSEARKYKLYLTMAQQSVAQLQDSSMINTILDNVGTIVGFRSKSIATEQLLLHQFSPQVEQGEILNIPSYNFYIKIAALKSHEPMSGETLLLKDEPSPEITEEVIASSREKYAIEYEEKAEDKKDRTKKDEPGKKSKSKNNDNNIKASKSGEEDKSVDDFDVPDVNA